MKLSSWLELCQTGNENQKYSPALTISLFFQMEHHALACRPYFSRCREVEMWWFVVASCQIFQSDRCLWCKHLLPLRCPTWDLIGYSEAHHLKIFKGKEETMMRDSGSVQPLTLCLYHPSFIGLDLTRLDLPRWCLSASFAIGVLEDLSESTLIVSDIKNMTRGRKTKLARV
jgi:hypothetical protein